MQRKMPEETPLLNGKMKKGAKIRLQQDEEPWEITRVTDPRIEIEHGDEETPRWVATLTLSKNPEDDEPTNEEVEVYYRAHGAFPAITGHEREVFTVDDDHPLWLDEEGGDSDDEEINQLRDPVVLRF